ncbi:MAG TPA: hypothetical protein VFC64_06735, partial [Atopostipes sp.]|nr:hypothetical protein [Atopostipes sp.]
ESEWLTDEYNPDIKRALIEIGDPRSRSSKEHTSPEVIERQRSEMMHSSLELHNWCQAHYIPQHWLPDHSALEDGIKELVEQLLEYKNTCFH